MHSQQQVQRWCSSIPQLLSFEDDYRTASSAVESQVWEPRVSRILNKAPTTDGRVRGMRWSQQLNKSAIRACVLFQHGKILTSLRIVQGYVLKMIHFLIRKKFFFSTKKNTDSHIKDNKSCMS